MENIQSLQNPEIQTFIKKFSHLFVEVKKRLLFILTAFLASTTVGFIFYEKIIKILVNSLGLKDINIVFTSPFQFINLAISCGLTTGLIISLPILIYQILSFLKPALKVKEFKMITRFLPISTILFIFGFIFGAFMMKWQIEISLTHSISIGIGNVLDISKLLTTILMTSILMGIGFQFPIILTILLRLQIIKPKQLSDKRMVVYLCSFIFAIMLPPDSILADVLLSLPLIFMFELTLILHRVFKKSH